ncbi:MAG: hypothetical protein P4L87_15670 [Formivibrio sp.]|nr:hypothetical protein [Formivibrio sp.]
MKKLQLALWAIAGASATLALNAGVITPDFANVPTGWATDRYAPNSFSDVGAYQGRSDVLGIGISSAQSLANRASTGQNSSFYNTQGDGYQFSSLQGAGSVLSADLWISRSMADPANGAIRTDMWGVMNGGNDYPIIGFANSPNLDGSGSSVGHFQVYDGDLGNPWVVLSTPVNYNAWNSLSIEFTGSSYIYSIDGTVVYTDNTVDGSTGFSAMIMQAYNFGDPANFPNENPADYTAYWSNTPVPEPTTMVAGALLLLPFGASAVKILRKTKSA